MAKAKHSSKKWKAKCAKKIARKNKRPYLILMGDEVERWLEAYGVSATRG